MAENEQPYSELKGGTARFKITGRVKIDEDSLPGAQQKEGSTWRHVNSSFRVQTDEGNSIYVRIWGGYKTDNPILYKFSADRSEGMIKVKWDSRKEPSVLEKVSNASLLRATLEKDESGKRITKEFLSEIDFEEYLQEHLHDNQLVTLTGDVEYSEYQGEVQRRFNLRNIYMAEPYEKDGETIEPQQESLLYQTYIVDSDSVSRRANKELEDNGETTINAFVPQYVSSANIGGKYRELKKTVPYPQGLVIRVKKKSDGTDDLELKQKLVEKVFGVSRGTVREVTTSNKIIEGYNESTVDNLEDVMSPELRELVELGIMTEEEIKEQTSIRGNKISEIEYKGVSTRKNPDTGEVRPAIFDDKYTEEALVSPIAKLEDEVLDGGYEDSYDDDDTVSEDDLEAFFG